MMIIARGMNMKDVFTGGVEVKSSTI